MPFDRRVWLECQALISDGYQVAVVCPRGNGDAAHLVINTVELSKYRLYAPGGSKLSFVTEYVYSFRATAWLTLKARRSGRFGVMQACRPPGHLLADRAGPSRSRRHPFRVRPYGAPVLGTVLTAADGADHGRRQAEANNYTGGKASSWSRAGKALRP